MKFAKKNLCEVTDVFKGHVSYQRNLQFHTIQISVITYYVGLHKNLWSMNRKQLEMNCFKTFASLRPLSTRDRMIYVSTTYLSVFEVTVANI